MQAEKKLCEDIARSCASASQEERPEGKPALMALWSSGFHPPELWENEFLLFKPYNLWDSGIAALENKHNLLPQN